MKKEEDMFFRGEIVKIIIWPCEFHVPFLISLPNYMEMSVNDSTYDSRLIILTAIDWHSECFEKIIDF